MATGNGRVAGKVAIVTGGSRGIGAATCRLLADEGANVVIADLLETEGKAVVKSIGEDRAVFSTLDVRSRDGWLAVLETCEARFGPPSVLVHDAGVMIHGLIATATEADFHAAMDVNVLGPFLGTQVATEAMRRAGGGSIVILSSNAGMSGSAGFSLYGASKAANALFARAAARELGPMGIRVNAISPGSIDTDMSNGPWSEGMDREAWWRDQPVARSGEVEDVAALVLFLASDESSYMTGTVICVDGGSQA